MGEVFICITPMSLKNGVLTIPIESCRDWDASESVKGKFVYAGVESDITFSPKHIFWDANTNCIAARAWQFTVNNSLQFAQLKQDGVYTYATEKKNNEHLICNYTRDDNGLVTIEVVRVENHEKTPELSKLASLLKQGIRLEKDSNPKSAPIWNAPSEWIDFSNIGQYSDIKDCIYLWYGAKDGSKTTFLYVGIVGDTRNRGESKRTLAQRLQEEQKKYSKEYGVNIVKFRYCALNNANGMDIPNMLKTIEMAEITVLSSLFFCANARDNISPLFQEQEVVLLNKSTSFKFVE